MQTHSEANPRPVTELLWAPPPGGASAPLSHKELAVFSPSLPVACSRQGSRVVVMMEAGLRDPKGKLSCLPGVGAPWLHSRGSEHPQTSQSPSGTPETPLLGTGWRGANLTLAHPLPIHTQCHYEIRVHDCTHWPQFGDQYRGPLPPLPLQVHSHVGSSRWRPLDHFLASYGAVERVSAALQDTPEKPQRPAWCRKKEARPGGTCCTSLHGTL